MHDQRSTHAVDGLIFTPIDKPLMCGTSWNQFKWKPTSHTVDLQVQIRYRDENIDKSIQGEASLIHERAIQTTFGRTSDLDVELCFIDADFSVPHTKGTTSSETNVVLFSTSSDFDAHNGGNNSNKDIDKNRKRATIQSLNGRVPFPRAAYRDARQGLKYNNRVVRFELRPGEPIMESLCEKVRNEFDKKKKKKKKKNNNKHQQNINKIETDTKIKRKEQKQKEEEEEDAYRPPLLSCILEFSIEFVPADRCTVVCTPLRLRPDKPEPNNLNTICQTLLNIEENISYDIIRSTLLSKTSSSPQRLVTV